MAKDAQRRTSQTPGLILSNDKTALLSGVGSPETEWINVEVGARYFRQNGQIWRKTGAGDGLGDWDLDFDPTTAGVQVPLYEDPIYWALGRWLGG